MELEDFVGEDTLDQIYFASFDEEAEVFIYDFDHLFSHCEEFKVHRVVILVGIEDDGVAHEHVEESFYQLGKLFGAAFSVAKLKDLLLKEDED